ncbi:hypothetical protein PTRA_a0860 [Pseudoalteromonas translucida KMM 520]|uniref:FlgO domain-containing protein n=1 Tax=Pseudoalteromonas translucida KMM 520 TaxID=1315283 RepID=A0A0U2X0A7_9GAMM|nr:FlgO family outer membrane protein [Pseudoalteromonas translucida]ALS32162.1 hypothetical protein PTRA_a0860 [Pseudoalteromonas translucida KMM 520]
MQHNLNFIIITLLFLVGCSSSRTEVNPSTNDNISYDLNEMLKVVQTETVHTEVDSTQFTPLKHHKTLVNYVEQMALDLVDTLESGSELEESINIAVTSIVDLDATLNNSNQLGNQISETLIHQLQKFGYGVVDFKTSDAINVNRRGDFVFSRDIKNLSKKHMASHVLGGTLIYRANGVTVNTRVINVNNKKVVASSRKFIPRYVLNKEDIYLSSN